MARTIRDSNLETRAARHRLKARGKPYYRSLEPGLHLGYRKLANGPGTWCARHYVGEQSYEVEGIGTADDYSDADGVRILDYRQAQNLARERATARAHHAAGKTGPITVASAMEAYVESLQARGRRSARDARGVAEALILPVLGKVEVQALKTEQIRKWRDGLTKVAARHGRKHDDGEGLRRRKCTANRVLTTLKAALNLAWRDGRTPSDTAWRRVEPFKGVDAARQRYLEAGEVTRLVNGCAEEDFRRLVEAGLLTACRYGELCGLKVADFNAASGIGIVTVPPSISKTKKMRHVRLKPEGTAMFKQWCAGRPGTELLFVHSDGRPWKKSHQDLRLKEACQRAGIHPPINFYALRHTWASLSVMGGMTYAAVAENMGNSVKIIQKHYAHLAPDYVADEVCQKAPSFGFKPSKRVVPLR
jgi:integrase